MVKKLLDENEGEKHCIFYIQLLFKLQLIIPSQPILTY